MKPRVAVPWATAIAMVAVIAAFAAELARGVDGWRPTAAELALLGAPTDGRMWRLVIAPLVHLGALHLAFNLIGLALIGPPLERALGRATAAITYVGGAVLGAAVSYAMSPFALTVGASGAIVAGAAALAVVVVRGGATPSSRRPAAIRLGVVAALHGVAWGLHAIATIGAEPDLAAHTAAALAGAAIALVAGREAPARRVALAGVVTAAVAAIAIAIPAPPVDWRADELRAAALERRFDQLVPARLGGADPALARRVDAEVIAPLTAVRDQLQDDPRVPAPIARRRATLRAYLDARLRALGAVARYLDSGDPHALDGIDAANREADHALAAPP